MNPKVSIIVPVYNASKTLSRCIDSIIGQEYQDFELLLIDDGSTDGSDVICDSYAERDARIRVFHKENSGVSDSRNLALHNAKGIYLQFLDSDDWITPNATRLFVETAEHYHCDMVISDFYRVVGERVSHKGDIEDDCVLTREEFAGHMIENPADFYYGVLWNKFYRRDIIETHHLRMDSDISWCEDFMFNLEYIRYSNVFYALQIPLYYYVKTKGSLATQGMSITKTIKMKLMVFEYYNNFYKHILTEEDYEKNRLMVYRFLVDAAKDGAVPPLILPGSQKLGEERISTCEEMVSSEGILGDLYRDRKLLEYYLEPVAIKNDMTLEEVHVLLCLLQPHQCLNRKELADFAGMTGRTLSVALSKLSQKGFIKVTTHRNTKEMTITFLPTVFSVLDELSAAQENYENARLAGFTEEEQITYARLSEKIKQNVQKIL